MALDGINALIAVCQQKTNVANDNALEGAKKQQNLVKKEQAVHAQQSNLEDYTRSKDVSGAQVDNIRNMLNADGLSTTGLNSLQVTKTDGAGNHYELDPSHADGTKGANNDAIEG